MILLPTALECRVKPLYFGDMDSEHPISHLQGSMCAIAADADDVQDFQPESFLILVVDDIAQNRLLVGSILDEVGYATTFASHGLQALERVRHTIPDLILLDLMMPEMDGLEVCRRLKAQPETANIPIIFLTASRDTLPLVEAFELGAADYLTKPFEKLELLARVRHHLELRHTRLTLEATLEALTQARDEALEAAYIKSQFLANMSHEIRTPMNAVLGITELLQMTHLDEQQQDLLQTLKNSGESLLVIINDILDFSKLEAGEVKLEQRAFSLQSLVRDIQNLFSAPCQTRNLWLKTDCDLRIPTKIQGDVFRLRQVLSNLINNALKFTHKGGVKVCIVPCNDRPSTDHLWLRFEITDTGIGIAPEDQDRLFQSFTQVDISHTRKYGGTGLGLAICKQLTNLMGGEIGCCSDVGQGSTFWLELPFDRALVEEGDEVSHAFPQLDGAVDFSQGKILCVEDNLVNQKVLRRQLALLGCDPICVNNGKEALARLEREAFDVVFMDCQMPVLDGFQTTLQLRRWEQETQRKHTTVVGLTAYSLQEDRDRCLAVGMDDYLSKPVSLEDLQGALKRWYRPLESLPRMITAAPAAVISPPEGVDWSYFHELTDGDRDLQGDLLTTLLEDVHLDIEYLTQAAQSHDFTRVYQIGHRWKGVGSTIGLFALARCGDVLEQASDRQDWSMVLSQRHHAQEILQAVQQFLETLQS